MSDLIANHIPASDLYRLLLQNLSGLAVLVFDRDLRYLTAQGGFLETAGFATDQFIGKTLSEVFPNALDQLLPVYQAALEGETTEFEINTEQYSCRVRLAPIKNNNVITSGLIVVEDITAQKRAEQALHQSEAQLQLLFDNSLDSIVLGDREARVIRANPAACKMFGRSEQELRTEVTLADLLDLSDTRYLTLFQTVLQTGHGRSELTGRRKDGSTFPLESSSTMLNRDPNAEQSWTIMRDMSDLKFYHEALVEREKLHTALEKETELSQLKSRMMERVAHEFRTPFAVIRLTIELITKYLEHLNPAQVKDRVSTIYSQIARLTDMLDDIDLAIRGALVPESLKSVPIDLSVLCRDIAQELETQFAGAGKFNLDLPASLTFVGDPLVLRNIFLHVLRNAAQFSNPSAAVKVILGLHNDHVDLRVIDNGIGILEHEQARIFESFFRGKNVGEIRGLGLGLTIVQDSVAAYRGKIKVTSIPNQGTTVNISFPRKTGAEQTKIP